MDRKTLPIFIILFAIIVVMISVLGRRVTTRQAASVAQSAQSVAPDEGAVLAMSEKPARTGRAIDRSTPRHLRRTTSMKPADATKETRPYRRGRKPLPPKTEIASANTQKGGTEWVTIPASGVPLFPRPKPKP